MAARIACLCLIGLLSGVARAQAPAPNPYRTVENWAKLPAGMEWGQVSGLEFDAGGHLWVIHRAEPPILEFDPAGNFIRSLGAPTAGGRAARRKYSERLRRFALAADRMRATSAGAALNESVGMLTPSFLMWRFLRPSRLASRVMVAGGTPEQLSQSVTQDRATWSKILVGLKFDADK